MSLHIDKKQITLSTLNKMKANGEKFTCLTSYESTMTSKICDAGIDVVLVGDSLGMVVDSQSAVRSDASLVCARHSAVLRALRAVLMLASPWG